MQSMMGSVFSDIINAHFLDCCNDSSYSLLPLISSSNANLTKSFAFLCHVSSNRKYQNDVCLLKAIIPSCGSDCISLCSSVSVETATSFC